MAHPTIDIVSEPDVNCPNPAYNCVEYCFQSNDFQTVVGTKATFTIELNPIVSGYAPGINIVIAGQPFVTGTTNTYNEINTTIPLTQVQFANNVLAALSSNTHIFSLFELKVSGTQMIGTAREIGVINDFVFDYTSMVTPPNNSDTNGTNDEFRENYRLVAEIWKCDRDTGELTTKISSEAYIPQSDGSFCINVGLKVASLLKTRFVANELTAFAWFDDSTIIDNIAVRYGESYSDTIDQCDVTPRHFDTTDCVRIINSAFQKQEAVDKTQDMCEGQWMSNIPDYTEFCEDTIVHMWINLFDIFVTPPPLNIRVHPFIEFFYTDGTSSIHITTQFGLQDANKIFAVSSGFAQVGFLADPLKTVHSWRMRIVVRDSVPPVPTGDTYFASKYFKLVSCCKGDISFYFLNEFGGYDTILFSQLDTIDIQQSNSVFESFLDCDDDALNGGQDIIDITAQDVFTVTSKFLDTYQVRRWIREFLTSPLKYVRKTVEDAEDEILSKVIVLSANVQYYSNDDNFLLLRIQYTLNENINLQRN